MPLHPKLVHLPIALAVLMPLITTGLLLAWWRGALQRRTWIVAIALQTMLVGSGLLAMRSGEADEERVESTVSKTAIHAHEEAAEGFVFASAGVLALTLGAGLIRRERAALAIGGTAVAGTLVVLALGYRTGQAGGELVYRHGAAAALATEQGAQPVQPPAAATGGHHHNDD